MRGGNLMGSGDHGEHDEAIPVAFGAEQLDLGNAMSCHTPTAEVLIPAGITLSVNPEARVYAALHEPTVQHTRPDTVCDVPVAIHNIGLVTASVAATLLEPADGSVRLLWNARPLSGDETERRSLGIVTRRTGFLEVTVSFCLPFELPDLGGRDRVRLVLHSHGTAHDCPGGRHALP
jgi:hypothetical protein